MLSTMTLAASLPAYPGCLQNFRVCHFKNPFAVSKNITMCLTNSQNGDTLPCSGEKAITCISHLNRSVTLGTTSTDDMACKTELSDGDCPIEGYSSVPECIQDISSGKIVIIVDDCNKGKAGSLVMAASYVTPEAIAYILKHGTGTIQLTTKEVEKLQLPYMNDKEIITSPLSAEDLVKSIVALANPTSISGDYNHSGHSNVSCVKYKEGGVLVRSSPCEASIDLAMLAGLAPVAVVSPLPLELCKFFENQRLKVVSISDLIQKKNEKLVARVSVARLPLRWGCVFGYCYKSVFDGVEYIAMVKGDIGNGDAVLVRLHSECLTGDIFGSARCDCGDQLSMSMELIEKAGCGVLVYLRGHEGRGSGLGHKFQAYNLMDDGLDTVEAYQELRLPVDCRDYSLAAQILQDLGVHTMRLISNNPSKYVGMEKYGLRVVERIPLLAPITNENYKYLETKRMKMGHFYGSDFNARLRDYRRKC